MSNHDAWVMVFALLYALASVGIPIYLYYKKIISSFVTRKIIHSISGLLIFVLLFLDSPIWAFALSTAITIFVLFSTQKSRLFLSRYLFASIHEDEEKALGYLQGPVSYCIATSLLCLLDVFFPYYNYVFIVAMLTMMYADTFAAIVGKRFGKHQLFGLKRTVEGSFTFFIIALTISLFVFSLFGTDPMQLEARLTTQQILTMAIGGSLGATAIELFSPSKWDDLLIPLGSSALLVVLNILI